MIRALIAAGLLVAASPVVAQTAVEQLSTTIVTDTVAVGFSEEQAEAIADCFTSRMTEDEATTVLATTDQQAQQLALAQMENYDAALACTAETMQ